MNCKGSCSSSQSSISNTLKSALFPVCNEPINSKKNDSHTNYDNYFFEIFGLKLFFDDVLLICIIFFLYQEGVKDNELFISLILLLLT